MIRSRVSSMRAGLLAAAALMLLVPGVAAYDGEVDAQIGVTGPTTAICPTAVSVTARVVDKEGNPLANQEVVWSTGETGMTDSNGEVTTTVSLSADITVTATTGESSAQITIVCQVAGITLPRTDTEAPAQTPALPILGAMALIGLAFVGRRRLLAVDRR